MAIRKPIFILLVNIVAFSLLFLFMASPGVDEEVGRFELQVHNHDHDDSDKSHPILENSIFRVTRQGKAYDANKNPECWIPGCHERNNRHAYVACKKIEATEFNALGLKDVERWLGGDYLNSDALLKDAIKHFLNAIKIDQYCAQPYANLGLVYFQLGRFDDAAKVWDQAIENDKDLTAKVSMYRGFMESFRGKGEEAKKYFAQARAADPDIDRQYLGLQPGTPAALLDLRSYGAPEENQALRDFLFYKELAPVSLGNYALLDPGTQDSFITNRYMILRKVLPPFVLRGFQRCVRSQIQNKKLKLGDGQSKRYVMYNDRCSRWVHYQLPDLVRRVIAHNARPSYTYFGGYVADSELTPHTDRAQCEFTMSLTVEHHPHNATWLLSLGNKPLFDRDDNFVGKYPEQMPPEDEIVDADLYAGDALLFMGRHLVHFRRGKLPAGQWTNQVFLHHVQEGFTKGLGK